jgi:hypothetical protein
MISRSAGIRLATCLSGSSSRIAEATRTGRFGPGTCPGDAPVIGQSCRPLSVRGRPAPCPSVSALRRDRPIAPLRGPSARGFSQWLPFRPGQHFAEFRSGARSDIRCTREGQAPLSDRVLADSYPSDRLSQPGQRYPSSSLAVNGSSPERCTVRSPRLPGVFQENRFAGALGLVDGVIAGFLPWSRVQHRSRWRAPASP